MPMQTQPCCLRAYGLIGGVRKVLCLSQSIILRDAEFPKMNVFKSRTLSAHSKGLCLYIKQTSRCVALLPDIFTPNMSPQPLTQCWAHIKCSTNGSVQFSSVTQSCLTPCDPMNCSTPGLPVHHQLPEFTQTHVHQVSDAIQPSHPLSSPSPPAPNPS